MNLGIVIALKDNFSANARNIQREYSQLSNGMDNAAAGIERAAQGIYTGMALVGAGAVTLGALAVPLNYATEFENSMARVSTLVDTSTTDMDKLALEMQRMGELYSGDQNYQAQAYYETLSAGILDTSDALSVLEVANKMAIGGNSDVVTSVDGLTSVLNAYGMEAKDAAGLSDEFFMAVKLGKTTIPELAKTIGRVAPIARTAGMSTEELLGSVAALTQNGLQTNEAVTGTRQVLQSIVAPSKQAQKAMEGLGLEWNMTGLKSKGFVGLMEDMMEKTGGNAEEIRKLIPGIEGFNAALSLGDNMERFAENMGLMKEATGSTEDAFKKMADTLQYRKDQIESTWSSVVTKIGSLLIPMATKTADAFIFVLEAVSAFITKFPKLSQTILVGVAAFGALAIGFGSVLAIAGAFGMVIPGLNFLLRSLGFQAVVTGTMIRTALLRAFLPLAIAAGVFYVFKQAWDANLGGMRDSALDLYEKMKLVGQGVWQMLTGSKDGAENLSDGTRKALEDLGLMGTVEALYGWSQNVLAFLEGFKTGIVNIVGGLATVLEPLWGMIAAGFQKLDDILVSVGALTPSEDSADQWERWGERVAYALGLIAAIKISTTVITTITLLITFFQSLTNIIIATVNAVLWVAKVFWRLSAPIRAVWSMLSGFGSAMSGLWTAVQPVLSFIGSGFMMLGRLVFGALGWIGRGIAFVVTAIAAIAGLPVWLTALIIGGIIAAGVAIYVFWEDIKQWAIDAWTAVSDWTRTTWEGIVAYFSELPGRITAFFSTLPETIGSFFSGIGESIAGFFAPIPGQIAQFFTDLPGILYQLLVDALAYAAVGALLGLALIVQGLTWLWTKFTEVFGALGQWLWNFFTVTLPTYVAQGFEWMVQTVSTGLTAIWTFFTVTLPQIGMTVWNFFTVTLPGYVMQGWNWIIQIVAAGLQAIWNFFTVTLPQIGMTVWNWITVQLPMYFQQGMEWMRQKVATGLTAIWNFFTVTMPQIGQVVWNWMTVQLPQYVSQGVNAMVQWISTLPGRFMAYFETITSNLATWGGAVVSWFAGLPGRMWSAISGGLGKLATDVSAKISSIMDGLPGWAKKALSGVGIDLNVKASGGGGGGGKVNIPGASTGGYIPKEGLVNLHPGEVVVNNGLTRGLKELIEGDRGVTVNQAPMNLRVASAMPNVMAPEPVIAPAPEVVVHVAAPLVTVEAPNVAAPVVMNRMASPTIPAPVVPRVNVPAMTTPAPVVPRIAVPDAPMAPPVYVSPTFMPTIAPTLDVPENDDVDASYDVPRPDYPDMGVLDRAQQARQTSVSVLAPPVQPEAKPTTNAALEKQLGTLITLLMNQQDRPVEVIAHIDGRDVTDYVQAELERDRDRNYR